MVLSIAQKILDSRKPFICFHTHVITRELLEAAIRMEKSMDLDVCVDEAGNPYLGHSKEYYEKVDELWADSMPLWETVELISKANIPVIVDCKNFEAWDYVEQVIEKIGAHRCLVHSFISDFQFPFERDDELDVSCEWSPGEQLINLKNKLPGLTTTASARGLPRDLLSSGEHSHLLRKIKKTLIEYKIDTVCLNVPDNTFSDAALVYFLEDRIIPHVMIDSIDTSRLTQIYIGETDLLSSASRSAF